jgi:hypothetical protein
MKRRMWLWDMAVFFLLSVVVQATADEHVNSIINCDIQNGPCIQMVGDRKVSLDVFPKPVKAMQDLTFRVTIDGPMTISNQPYIDLGMPAMRMGPNRVLLEDLGGGVFEGRGVIVRCKSGKRTWQAEITIPDMGKAKFIFDVIY